MKFTPTGFSNEHLERALKIVEEQIKDLKITRKHLIKELKNESKKNSI